MYLCPGNNISQIYFSASIIQTNILSLGFYEKLEFEIKYYVQHILYN